MKTLYCFVILIVCATTYADTENSVIVRGKVGHSFDENSTIIIDSFGQEYSVPTKAFPEKFSFKQGQPFQLVLTEEDLKHIKLKKQP